MAAVTLGTAPAPHRRDWGRIAVTLLSVLVAAYAFAYFLVPEIAPPSMAGHLVDRPTTFLVHVAASAAALLLGPAQFVPRLRARQPRLHHLTGRIYVGASVLGGIAGLILALHTNAGLVPRLGFTALALTWLTTTLIGLVHAMRRDLAAHRRWMIRSFALAFAAVTLRLLLPIGPLAGLAFLPWYGAVAWLCWTPNLLLAELLLRRRRMITGIA